MLSAGYLGGPGIGYKQDYFASQYIQTNHAETYERVKAPNENGFLVFPKITGIDGAKAGMISDNGKSLMSEVEIAGDRIKEDGLKGLRDQSEWWAANKQFAESDAGPVGEAKMHGSRMAIRYTAIVPAAMAVLYLLLLVAFRAPKTEEKSGGH